MQHGRHRCRRARLSAISTWGWARPGQGGAGPGAAARATIVADSRIGPRPLASAGTQRPARPGADLGGWSTPGLLTLTVATYLLAVRLVVERARVDAFASPAFRETEALFSAS